MPRRALLAPLLAVAVLTPASQALAHREVPVGPPLPGDPAIASTDNIEHLARFPEHTGTAGGTLSQDGKRFYLTDPRGVYVYDTTKPDAPTLLGSLPLLQMGTGVALAQEDPDTDDRILLVDAAATATLPAGLQVVDVSNPKSLKVLSSLPVTDHTWTCISGVDAQRRKSSCAWAYGRTGNIVDLRNPAKAALLPNTWRAAVNYGNKSNSPYTHDLTEIRPGLVMSAGSTAILMDTTNPAAPLRLTAITQPGRFTELGYHSAEWARGGTSPWLVLGTEIAPSSPNSEAGSDCKGGNSVIETWDARAVVKALKTYRPGTGEPGMRGAKFVKRDAFDAAGRGVFLQGSAPGHVSYCAHWMELHPAFTDSGRMAVSYYNRGTRFVDVRRDGTMKEFGWIVGADSDSGSPQWITKNIVYLMDYRRGLEVVRLLDKPATRVTRRAAVHEFAPNGLRLASSSRPVDGTSAPLALVVGSVLVLGTSLIAVRRRTRVA
ncbi:MAG TPA: hypothetical protein VNA30_04495 [Mycobacteriales bacterium]|nr:hypothetical protein [Mycobacteriales bacterium]